MKTEEKNPVMDDIINTASKMKDFIHSPAYLEWKKVMDNELWTIIREISVCSEEKLIDSRGRLRQQFRIMDSIEGFVRKAESLVNQQRGDEDDSR